MYVCVVCMCKFLMYVSSCAEGCICTRMHVQRWHQMFSLAFLCLIHWSQVSVERRDGWYGLGSERAPVSTFRALESQAGWHAHVGTGYLNASPFPQLHPYPLNRQTSAPKQTGGSAARTAAGARVPSPSSGPTEQHATLSSMSLRQNPSLSLSRIPLQQR